MKTRYFMKPTRLITAMAICMMVVSTATMAATGGYSLKLLEDSKLWLEGDSTIHAYEAEATELVLQSDVSVAKDANLTAIFSGKDKATRVNKMRLTVPVKELKSGIVGLAGRLRKTLKYKKHPNIIFEMESYTIGTAAEKEGLYEITAKGDLTLAGVTKPVTLKMTGELEGSHVNVKGEQDLLMTDFGVEPPTMMFGKITTDDKVVVKWDLKVTVGPSERNGGAID